MKFIIILMALALLASVAAFDLGSLFPPLFPPPSYSSYNPPNPTCKPRYSIQYPITIQDVQKIVQYAIANRLTVKAFGAKHSATDIICTEGIPVDMGKVTHLRMNADGSVTSGAGVHMAELGKFLHENGKTLEITPAYADITVGGAIGTGAHGSSLTHQSSISQQTIGMKIVDGLGNIVTINSANDLKAFRVHLGLLGIVYEATLATVPDYKLTVENKIRDDSILFNGEWRKLAMQADSFILYWFPSTSELVVSTGKRVPANATGKSWSHDHVPSTSFTFNTYAVPALELIQGLDSPLLMQILECYLKLTLYTYVPDFVPIYTDNSLRLTNPGTGTAYEMLAARCLPNSRPTDSPLLNCLWNHWPFSVSILDNEVSLATEDMPYFLNDMKDILSKSNALFPLQGILMRFSVPADTYMLTSNGRESIHFEWYALRRLDPINNAISGMAAYQTMMQTLIKKYNGRIHWGKGGMAYHTRELLQQKMPQDGLSNFISEMKKRDPNGVFMNNFGRRLLNQSEVMDTDPKMKHCANDDNCICAKNSDCATNINQVCGSIEGYENYPVCKNNYHLYVNLSLSVELPFLSPLQFFLSLIL